MIVTKMPPAATQLDRLTAFVIEAILEMEERVKVRITKYSFITMMFLSVCLFVSFSSFRRIRTIMEAFST